MFHSSDTNTNLTTYFKLLLKLRNFFISSIKYLEYETDTEFILSDIIAKGNILNQNTSNAHTLTYAGEGFGDEGISRSRPIPLSTLKIRELS